MKRLWKDSLDLRQNLRRRMPKLVAAYFKEGRRALAPGTSWEEMHAFRLRTKRFRYTLETFSDLYGQAIDRRIEGLKKLQTLLGKINDAVVTSAMLSTEPGMEAIREELDRDAVAKSEKLREFWTATFDAPGEERRWQMYLTNYACHPGVAPRGRRIAAEKAAE